MLAAIPKRAQHRNIHVASVASRPMPQSRLQSVSSNHASPGKHLAGKRAVITGSTSGIGLGIARRFASHGCNVMLNGLGDANEISMLCQQLTQEFGVAIGYHPANMAQPLEIKQLIEYTEQGLGGIDILVNNAGSCTNMHTLSTNSTDLHHTDTHR
jgi:NAD(P)-dependent dehydrogenase (short-subunit alcohol dehydrogenase family)